MRPAPVHQCPGCGMSVEPGDDYVVAREYDAAGDFTLHNHVSDHALRGERRFHVEHFRGRIGDYVYQLVDHEATRPHRS